MDPGLQADKQGDRGLPQTQEALINHMGKDIGGDVQPGPMFAFDDLPLPADDLDRVKTAVPDGQTCQSKSPFECSFHGNEKVFMYDHGDDPCDQCGHRQHDPVGLIDKPAQQLADINNGLTASAAVMQFMFAGCRHSSFRHSPPPERI